MTYRASPSTATTGPTVPEQTITDNQGRVWTADEFARSPYAHMINLEAFHDMLLLAFGVEDYERRHALMEIRGSWPEIHAEGSG